MRSRLTIVTALLGAAAAIGGVAAGVRFASIVERPVTIRSPTFTGGHCALACLALYCGYVVLAELGIAIGPGLVIAPATVGLVRIGVDLTPVVERSVAIEAIARAGANIARTRNAADGGDVVVPDLIRAVILAASAVLAVRLQAGFAAVRENPVAIANASSAIHDGTGTRGASRCGHVVGSFRKAAIFTAATFFGQAPPAANAI